MFERKVIAMKSIAYWLQSCSFEEPVFHEADEACAKLIAPYFQQETVADNLENFITTTLKLYREVQYIRDMLLGDKLRVNLVSRKQFAANVMLAWREKYSQYASIVSAICYDLSELQ